MRHISMSDSDLAVRSHGSLRNDTPKPLPRFPLAKFATDPPFPAAAAAAMSASAVIRDFDDFVKVHGILLAASGVPPPLYRQLFRKLSSETFDGGDFFSIEPCEGGRQRRLLLSTDFLGKESNLREVPGLAERMATLMCVDLDLKSNDENPESEIQEEEKSGSLDNVLEILQTEMDKVKERGVAAATWLELEELGIDDEMLKSLELSTKFPNLVALNLWGNKLKDAETIIQEVTKCRRLKAIWLNDNSALRDWYVMDELGSALRHSDDANFRVAPFLFMPDGKLASAVRILCEFVLTYRPCTQAQGRPEWLQPTYNLETQLSQLIGDYFVRKQDALNNLWILKPWNMARTIDTTVTEDLSAIIRLMETGPKICQKYIEHPALFKGRKFDLRYIVLVRSMDPVQIFLFDVFWVCCEFPWLFIRAMMS
ncbi:hypothetical protein GW17_00020536 [Ensete ventricosum]|nr:hypothetical protein GW17_00020536 [Ensete ventricosum]